MSQVNSYHLNFWKVLTFSVIALFNFLTFPVLAAQNLILKIGPLERSLPVNDLVEFAQNGEISENLEIYKPLLNPQIQQLLKAKLEIDPNIGDQLIEELSRSTLGKSLLEKIITAIPGSSVEVLQAAIALAIRQSNELSIVSILQAYPEENVTIDLTKIVGIALQINGSHLQSQMINPLLDRTLKQEIHPENLPPLNPALADQMQVFQRTINFYDHTRNRQIPVNIFTAENTQKPLIVMSHGFGSDRQFLRYLAVHLASHGFTVVSVEHIGSNFNIFNNLNSGLELSQLLSPQEFIDRPEDISFVLDQLTLLNQSDETLTGKLNTENVSIIGHSFGGYTALVLAGGQLNFNYLKEYCHNLSYFGRNPADWLQCVAQNLPNQNFKLQDPRIKQAIALNPLVGSLFGEKGLENVSIPTMILASGDDALTPTIQNQLRPFSHLKGEKYLIVALGATHLSVTDQQFSGDAIRENNLTTEVIGTETDNLKQVIKGISLALINQLNEEENKYKDFISADYVQNLSTDQIQLRFTTEIPSSLNSWLNSFTVNN